MNVRLLAEQAIQQRGPGQSGPGPLGVQPDSHCAAIPDFMVLIPDGALAALLWEYETKFRLCMGETVIVPNDQR